MDHHRHTSSLACRPADLGWLAAPWQGGYARRRGLPAREESDIPASILIADDDPNILRALSFLMQRQGHRVRTAADGEAALAAVSAELPDLLLLDVMMPRSSGHDVCRALRASAAYDGVRIIMLTARGQEADQRAGLDLGADAYVTKPFAIGEVIDRVAEVLARPRLAPAAPG